LLLRNDRLNTRNLLRRKRFNIPTINCIMCNKGVEETMKHLLFECEFAQLCWTALHIVWDLSLVVDDMIIEGKRNFGNICYMEVIILATWAIRIHRNNFIFNSEAISFARWKKNFRELFLHCKHRAKPSLEADMTAWLSPL
jgi:ubiquitin C-terminal hydrolase